MKTLIGCVAVFLTLATVTSAEAKDIMDCLERRQVA